MRKERKELLNILSHFFSEDGVSVTETMDLIEELYGVDPLSAPLEVRKQQFVDSVKPFVEEMGRDAANSFCKYWLQISPKGRKFKFEKEKTWNLKLRISVWMKNNRSWSVVSMLRK